MTSKKKLIFFVGLMLFCIIITNIPSVQAQQPTQVKIDLKNDVLDEKNIIEIKLSFETGLENDYIIKPQSTAGVSAIYDNNASTWVYSNDSWLNMPKIQKEMQVKVEGLYSETAFISFLLQNTKTGQIHTTQQVKVWRTAQDPAYIAKLNYSLQQDEKPTQAVKEVRYEEKRLQDNDENIAGATTQPLELFKLSKKYVPAYLGIFVLFVFLGIMVELHNARLATKV